MLTNESILSFLADIKAHCTLFTFTSSLLMVGQHCVIEAFVWMLYCLTGREAGVGGGIVHMCVLTWTFCDGFQLDG